MADEIQAYRWAGLDRKGKRVNGVIRALSIKEAQNELKKLNVEVISIDKKSRLALAMPKKKIKAKDIMLFTRYLSTMLASGLPILQALDVIGREQENPAMQSLVTTMRNDIASGKTLSESFSQFSQYFDDLYISLIRAGEKSGTLDKILKRLVNYLEKTEILKRKIKKALVYPTVILIIALGVSLILLLFVVPQFQAIFSSFGADLPLFTRMVVNFSALLRNYFWLFFAVIGLAVWGFRRNLKESVEAQERLDRFKLKLPVIGPLLKKGIVARYTRTLAITLDAGVPIIEAMKLLENIMGSHVYSKAVVQICKDVASGNQLYVSMNHTKLFPSMVVQMISIGETSGSLAEMLNKVADYYEEEVNAIVDNLSSLLEPLIMVLLGGVIGTFVVAMYLPIFKLGSIVK
ncbi:MAG TPA: type II secretion system F family protein [Gammaproteobacteria bacterium]|nr:type II secretion system F family protein [Gammaproteobacteria bacterium]